MPKSVKIVDRGWNKIRKQALKVKGGKGAFVGIQGSKAQLQSKEHGPVSNVELGVIHEFGTKDGKIPERPMFRQTFDDNLSTYNSTMMQIANNFYQGMDVDGELLLLGEQYRSGIISNIKGRKFVPWADSTAEQKEKQGKGGDVPLWDTGQLVNSITVIIDEL